MRKFRRIKNLSNNSPWKVCEVYLENFCEFNISVISSVSIQPKCWEEVFDKPKLFKLL